MANSRLTGWIAQRFDDYVEETVVGKRAWVIVLAFALGLPILTAMLDVAFPTLYRAGNVAISLFIGTVVGLALVLVARERERFRTAAIDHTGDIAALRKKPWGEFETLVGQVFRAQGYVVKERGGLKRDHGVDLIAERDKERVLIQCKHWLAWKVGEGQVKELYADVKTQAFTEGRLVTCGRFTEFAMSWAKRNGIRLIDGESLVQLIQLTGISDRPPAPADGKLAPTLTAPRCPNCHTPLRRHSNRYDESRFWGCPNPACNWTLDEPTAGPGTPYCSHGHLMVALTTTSGADYWGCSNRECSRKRLFGSQ
jgi:restriction system protein